MSTSPPAKSKFKLKKANAPTKVVTFDGLPRWQDLASRISGIYKIPQDRVELALIDGGDVVPYRDQEDLEQFYNAFYNPDNINKLVVQNVDDPDREYVVVSGQILAHPAYPAIVVPFVCDNASTLTLRFPRITQLDVVKGFEFVRSSWGW
jgi:hypothetical protein